MRTSSSAQISLLQPEIVQVCFGVIFWLLAKIFNPKTVSSMNTPAVRIARPHFESIKLFYTMLFVGKVRDKLVVPNEFYEQRKTY